MQNRSCYYSYSPVIPFHVSCALIALWKKVTKLKQSWVKAYSKISQVCTCELHLFNLYQLISILWMSKHYQLLSDWKKLDQLYGECLNGLPALMCRYYWKMKVIYYISKSENNIQFVHLNNGTLLSWKLSWTIEHYVPHVKQIFVQFSV